VHLIKSIIIAFSIYSKIPVMQFEWKEEDMKYMLCFFPWIGAVIGGCVYLWCFLCRILDVGTICYAFIGAAIPLFVTGGFHVDGFLDTMDAFHSYKPREEKLKILKDSHIGAFSVIMLAGYGLIYVGAFSEIMEDSLLRLVCAGFFLSRCLSGLGVVSFPAAKKEGMLYHFADSAHRSRVKGMLMLQTVLCIGFMVMQSIRAGILVTAAAFLTFAYYYHRSKKELGGITGDTAGYFVLLCEESIVVSAAVMQIVGQFAI